MYTIILILIVLASVLMCLTVLIQESKGGGLAASYASGNTLLGAPKTTQIIEKITAGLAIAILVLCIASTAFMPQVTQVDSVMDLQQPTTTAPALPTLPEAPAAETAPAATEAPAETPAN